MDLILQILITEILIKIMEIIKKRKNDIWNKGDNKNIICFGRE